MSRTGAPGEAACARTRTRRAAWELRPSKLARAHRLRGRDRVSSEARPYRRLGVGERATNRDLLLLRATIQEARKAYKVDASHVYLVGH